MSCGLQMPDAMLIHIYMHAYSKVITAYLELESNILFCEASGHSHKGAIGMVFIIMSIIIICYCLTDLVFV